MSELRDIKPLLEIPDFSFFAYLAALLLGFFAFAFLFYKLFVLLFKKRIDEKKMMIKELKELDFKDSKRAAYKITKYGRELIYDDRSLEIFEELVKRLGRYKYKKRVPAMDRETIQLINLFIKIVDE